MSDHGLGYLYVARLPRASRTQAHFRSTRAGMTRCRSRPRRHSSPASVACWRFPPAPASASRSIRRSWAERCRSA